MSNSLTMTEILTAMDVLKRLSGALLLLKLAETIIPRLVSNGHTSPEVASKVLGQIPTLRSEITHQIEAVKAVMEMIQDRVEAIAQFLLLHRSHIDDNDSAELNRLLGEVRGA